MLPALPTRSPYPPFLLCLLVRSAPGASSRRLPLVAPSSFLSPGRPAPLLANRASVSGAWLRLARLAPDPPHGVYPANPPRAGRQQGYAGSDGCAGGPDILRWG